MAGEVFDKVSGEPLIGVTVLDKSNPSKGTTTDVDGKFTLQVKSGNNTVLFSYIGYKPLEMQAKDIPSRIAMEELSTELGEVVVVGYGTQKK